MKCSYLGQASVLVLTTMLAVCVGSTATAQTAPAQAAAATDAADAGTTVTEVIVTGSLIGGPKDKALPVDVVTTNEISQRGMPTITQLVKTIPSSGSVIGENNRFGGGNGTSTVNLRNLGINRTLVLWNGRRLATSIRSGGGVDLNLAPSNAIQRIEVLKDGAAATYGSDAIGGVVNFISRTDLNGLEFNGQYQFISGSKGDYNAGLAWGWRGDRGNILLTANYRARSELPVWKRDWALLKGEAGYLINPLGGWAATGNPGVYNTSLTAPAGSPDTGFTSNAAFNTTSGLGTFTDIGCAALGGAPNVLGSKSVSGSACNFQYTNFDNLVEKEQNYQLYGQVNFDVTATTRFHAEVMYADNKTPLQSWAVTGPNQWPTPMLASGASPGGGLSPIQATGQNEQSRFYIPASNPGLIALVAQIQGANCSGAVLPYGVDSTSCATGLAQAQAQANNALLYGVAPSQTTWRPFGYAGDPSTGDRHTHYTYETQSWRIEGGFKGELPFGIHYDTNLTYQEIDYQFSLADLSVDRLQLALRGLGGAGCNSQNPADAGNSAKGCYYLNPFSNGYATSLSGFTPNPYYISTSSIPGFNDALAQRSAVYNWLEQSQSDDNLSRLLVLDATFNGEVPFKLWTKDNVAWAAGVQYRYDRTIDNPATPFDALQTPCVDSPPYGDGLPTCPGTGNGPFLFNANRRPYDVDRKIKAAFTEWRIPVTDSLVVTAAGRIESYEGLGSTTNPKLSARWQAMDWLAFRGSVGSTYRAPLATQTTTGFNRGLTNANGSWRANDTYGNPNLRAETADTWSVGTVLNKWRLRGSIDYWSFDFKNPLTTEAASDLLAIMFPGGATDPGTNCGATAYSEIQKRFTFAGACSRANITSYRTNNINGGPVKTTGYDYELNFDAGNWWMTDVTAGVDGSYLLSYDESPYSIEGFTSSAAGVQKRAGTFRASSFVSYPRLRSNLYMNLSHGIHNLRWQVRYVSKTTQTDATAKSLAATFGQQIKVGSYTQHDVTYRVDLPWQTQLNLSVQNVFNQDPPFAFAMQYNYDPSTVNPLGRVYSVGLKKKF